MKVWQAIGQVTAVAIFVAGAVVVASVTSKHVAAPATVPAIAKVPKPSNAPRSTPALVASSTHHGKSRVSARRSHPRQAPHTAQATPVAQVTRVPGNMAPPGVAGAVVAIDPRTGKMVMPSPEQMQRLSAAAAQQPSVSRNAEGLIERHYPNGMVEVDLAGRFQDYATVRIRPDGTKEFHCVTDTSADALAREAQAEHDGDTPEGTARRGVGAPKEAR